MVTIKRKTKNFVDYYETHWPDKTIDVIIGDDEEYEVTYNNEAGDTFSVIFRQKKFPIGFMAKW